MATKKKSDAYKLSRPTDRKITIELTEREAKDLEFYLVLSTRYRMNQQKACQELAAMKKDDGSPEFPMMQDNVKFWEEMNELIDTVSKMLVAEIYKDEER